MSDRTVIATLPKNSHEDLVVALDEFRGNRLLDLRLFAQMDGADEKAPTKRGISINIRKLPALIEALHDAEAEAKRRGLLDGRG